MKEVVIPSGEVYEINGGMTRLKTLEIRDDATLVFDETVTLVLDSIVAHPGAKILYRSNEYNENPSFNLYALSAEGVQHLSFFGNGKDGEGIDKRASKGSNGRNAGNPSFSYPKGRKAKSGGRGKSGRAGMRGEDAVDFFLHFPGLKPGSEIAVSAIGGAGGNGQPGGDGGKGGNRSATRDGKNGGAGGNGGNGGDGGDSGQVFVFLVIDDDTFRDRAESEKIIETIRVSLNTAPGDGGSGGSGGSGGQPGKGAYIGPGKKKSGPDGSNGSDGKIGDGPRDGGLETWTSIDVMALSAYNQFVAQQLAQP